MTDYSKLERLGGPQLYRHPTRESAYRADVRWHLERAIAALDLADEEQGDLPRLKAMRDAYSALGAAGVMARKVADAMTDRFWAACPQAKAGRRMSASELEQYENRLELEGYSS
jgi:hypothetical protein